MARENFSSNAPWEETVGYSRAVRVDRIIEISGTTASENGIVLCIGDMEGQTRIILQKIESAILSAGGKLSDVVRTRIYTTDISRWDEIGKVHGEYFRNIRPATAMVEVSRLINSDMLVEIEATCVINDEV